MNKDKKQWDNVIDKVSKDVADLISKLNAKRDKVKNKSSKGSSPLDTKHSPIIERIMNM